MADLSKLIDISLLQAFGEGTIVPIRGTIATIATALEALSDEVDALEPGSMDGTFGKRLQVCEQNVLALVIGLQLETEAEVNGTSDNIIVETFDSTSGYIIGSGAYDSTNKRIYA